LSLFLEFSIVAFRIHVGLGEKLPVSAYWA